jgi:hypothetical protein
MSPRIISFAALASVFAPLAALAAPADDLASRTLPPAAAASTAPAATAAPAVTPPTYVRFVDAELLLGERVANSLSPNLTGPITNSLRAGAEYKFFGRNFAELEYRRWNVDHSSGLVTQPATGAQTFVPARRFSEEDVIFNSSLYGLGYTYLSTSTIIHSNNEGLPTVHSAFGFGLERLPDPTRAASLFGSYYYFPEVSGKLSLPDGTRPNLRYKLQTFRFGGSLAIPQTNAFLTANLVADHYLRKENAPGNATHTSASLGIGYHL